ncbi:MAG: methyl-accepting chemotaxis protein [Candidatus Saelkia tenebricola]|nr:methyl-accepting chemotaxis protein [Candidatus Saelkia tenebricola]
MAGNKRRIYFIDKKFQTQFIVKFCLLVIVGSLITVSLLYITASRTTTVGFENTKAVVKTTADFIRPILIQTVIIVTVLISFFSIMLTLFISHKIAGPLYRLKKEFEMIEEGDLSSDFKLRGKDQLQNIADSLRRMKAKLRFYITELKSSLDELEDVISKGDLSQDGQDVLEEKVKKIKENLSRFNV